MARLPRLTLTDYPHHVILRGNNRQVIFSGESDMRRMLSLLEEHSLAQGVDGASAQGREPGAEAGKEGGMHRAVYLPPS